MPVNQKRRSQKRRTQRRRRVGGGLWSWITGKEEQTQNPAPAPAPAPPASSSIFGGKSRRNRR